jgi:DNA-directed RNA polymerase subunit RPC12/RpoP
VTPSRQDEHVEHACPHCAKPFSAPLLDAESSLRGFKCPHCRLFVPLERAEQSQAS